jgi:hypothetical protein
MSGGGVDIWIQSFAPGTDAVSALQRVFGIDEARANAICQTIPRAVRRNAPPRDADEIAAALRAIGAKVELRPHKGDARGSAPGAPRPAPRASSPGQLRPDAHVSGSLPMPVLDARGSAPGMAAPMRTAQSSGAGLPVPSFDAAAPEVGKKPSASLDPFDESSSGGGLELAFDPEAERARAPKPAPRAGVEPRSLAPIAPAEEPVAATPEKSSGWSMPSLSFGLPGWVRGLGCFSGLSLLFFVLRMARCAWAFSDAAVPPSPAEIEAMRAENEAAMLAGAMPLEAFLARPAAMLGRDVDRNRGFATRLRTLGATRVLVTDIARVSGGDLGLTLVVELPDNDAARHQIATEIERYYANGMPVEAGDVAVPEPGERYEVVDLE